MTVQPKTCQCGDPHCERHRKVKQQYLSPACLKELGDKAPWGLRMAAAMADNLNRLNTESPAIRKAREEREERATRAWKAKHQHG